MTALIGTRDEVAMLDSIFPEDSPYRAVAEAAMERASTGRYPTPAWLQGKTGQPKRVCAAVIRELERRRVIGTLAQPKADDEEAA